MFEPLQLIIWPRSRWKNDTIDINEENVRKHEKTHVRACVYNW